ncbi:MAG: heme-degrading domain-containing protein [Candidatus Nanopelagicales bacterium]
MTETTGGYTSAGLAEQAVGLEQRSFTVADAVALGMLAVHRATAQELPIVLEVHHLGRVAFRAALPGSLPASDDWIRRKANVVRRFTSSTLAMRVRYEERGQSFAEATGLDEAEYAAHGGGLPIVVRGVGPVGAMYVSGLPQVEDHEFAVGCLRELATNRPG